MADITIVAPSSQVQNVGGAGQSPGGASGAHSLPQGSQISGTISGRDPNGNYLLKTSQGTFALRSSVPLTYNSDVTIRVGANAGGNVSARIVSVNGESFADFAAPATENTDSVSTNLLTQSAPATPAADAAETLPSGVRALVISVPPASEGQPANTGLTQGATVLVRAAGPANETGFAPQQGQTQAEEAPSTSSAAPVSIQAEATAAAQPQQVAQNPQQAVVPQNPVAAPQPLPASTTGTPVSYSTATAVETELAPAEAVTQVSQVQPEAEQPTSAPSQAQQTAQISQQAAPAPQASAASASLYSAYTKQSAVTQPPPAAPLIITGNPSATAGEQLPAQVISTAENGTLNLSTPLGAVTVQAPSVPALSSLSPGTLLTLEVLTAATTEATATLAASPASLNELAGSWQSLKDILNATTTDESASPVLARLPELGPAFLSQSTAFISALIQGEARTLLGDDTIESLKQNGRTDLLEKFSSEAAAMSESFNAPVTRETPSWQTFFLPFVFQEALQQARIYVKRDMPKKEKQSKSADDTRFVVEVDLSETGPLQLDGLVRKKDNTLAFDLIIRSHNAFSSDDQSEILAIYNSAAELTGFKGSLAFQVTRDFPVKPLEETAGNEDHGITV